MLEITSNLNINPILNPKPVPRGLEPSGMGRLEMGVGWDKSQEVGKA